MITFETWLPLLLLPLPYLVNRLSRDLNDSQLALKVPFIDTVKALERQSEDLSASGLVKKLFLAILWLLLLVSCCRPVWVGEPIPVQEEARNVLLAVDISESMQDRDIVFNNRYERRIDIVKYRLGEFIERRSQDRLGLILFADAAYLQSPLTFDNTTVNQYLQEARVGFAGRNTAIGDAIALGVKRLVERDNESRILILLTDGANTAGKIEPLEASRVAAEQGIKIYTIGIYQESILFSSQAANTLKEIAAITDGQHFIASNDQQLERIYRQLDSLEPTSQDERMFTPTIAYFHIPLSLFFVLSLAAFCYQVIVSWIQGRQESDRSTMLQRNH